MSIERKAISALKWATAAKLVVQIVSWAGTLVIVRLLTPHDYGLMAKVSVVCSITAAIAELGLEAAIVRSPEIVKQDLQKLYGVSLLLGIAMTAIVAGASPLFSRLFNEPQLTWPIAAASLQIVVAAVAIVPSALWTRELSFKRLSTIEMASGTASILVTLLLALYGAGVWALVLGTLFGATARSVALLTLGSRVRPNFSIRGIGEHIKFGLTLVGNRVSYFLVVQSDVLIGSRFLSTVEIGRYSVALQLATLPMAKVMGTINQILLPAMARQQDEPARVRQAVLKSLEIISLAAFPALWGISSVAPELVTALLGENWLQAVPALVILPLVVPVRMLSSVVFTTSLALGNRQLDLRNTSVNFILLPTGFYIGAHWGLVGLCAAWLISVPVAYSFSIPSALRFIGIRPSDLLAACGTPALAAGAMYAGVVALRPAVTGHGSLAGLFSLVTAGGIIYVAVMAVVSRRHLVNAGAFVRTLLARDVP